MKLDQIKRGMKIVTEKETFVTAGVEIRGKHKLIHDIGIRGYLAVNDDLTSANGNPEWDVQEIWDITVNGFELIWERPEVKELTINEISKLLGYAIKVVGGEK